MPLWKRGEAGPAWLVVVSLAGREDLLPDYPYPLKAGETTTVGRHESCDIQVVDGVVSRKHLQVRHDGGSDDYLASDPGSANGTLVNGRRLAGEVPLVEGDRVEIGNSRMVFTRKKFRHHGDALQHFRRQGEQIRGTMVKGP